MAVGRGVAAPGSGTTEGVGGEGGNTTESGGLVACRGEGW